MSYDFSKLNKHNYTKVDWGVETKEFKYTKLSELYKKAPEEKYIVKGMFFIKTQYGLQVVAILPEYKSLVCLPKTENDTISELLSNNDFVSAVKSGNLSITIRQYHSKTYKKTCYAVEYHNVDEIF